MIVVRRRAVQDQRAIDGGSTLRQALQP